MRTRLLAALAACALTVPLLGLTAAESAPADAPAASDAQATLARAQALFTEKSPTLARRQAATDRRSATLALNDLRQVRDQLSPDDRRVADSLLARPTGRPSFPGEWRYKVKEEKPVCGPTICVHYVASTRDAPPLRDGDGDGIPNEVERALAVAEHVNASYVGAGYRRPDRDRRRGGNNKLDVYLNNIGRYGLYGYCTSDQKGKSDGSSNFWAYCVIDDDFSRAEFPTNTPRENQQVTLAHEYFHAVQYAYDANEAGWFLEATATWAEDELYDRVNDNWNYLPYGQMGTPRIPLNTFGGLVHYGNWVFFRYLTETYPAETGGIPNLVVDLLRRGSNRATDPGPNASAMQALRAELVERGTTLSDIYTDYAVANRTPKDFYEEGSAYKPARPKRFTLTAAQRGTGAQSTKVRHLSSQPVRFLPGKGVATRGWKIRIKVDLQPASTVPSAHVLVYNNDGSVDRSTISGSQAFSFGSRGVKYVDLLLVNASPGSDRGRTTYSARAFK